MFLISTHKHRLCLGEAVLTSTHNLSFEQKYENYQNFSTERFHFWVVKFSIYLNRRVFVMSSFSASGGVCFVIMSCSLSYCCVWRILSGYVLVGEERAGPSCSKLTMSLVNDSLKFTSSDTQLC